MAGTLKSATKKLYSYQSKTGVLARDSEALFREYMRRRKLGEFDGHVFLTADDFIQYQQSELQTFKEQPQKESALKKFLEVVIGERYLMEKEKDISVKEAADQASSELMSHIDIKMDQMMLSMQQTVVQSMRSLFEETINMTLLSMAEGIKNFAPVGKTIIADSLMESMSRSLFQKGEELKVHEAIPDLVFNTAAEVQENIDTIVEEKKKTPRILEIPRDKGGRIKWGMGKESVFAVLQDLENQGLDISTAKNVNDNSPSTYVQIKRNYKGNWDDMIKEYREYVNA